MHGEPAERDKAMADEIDWWGKQLASGKMVGVQRCNHQILPRQS